MPKPIIRKPVSSLTSLSTECVLSNLLLHTPSLQYLPNSIKERILNKLLTKCAWNVFSSEILSLLIHPNLKRINLSSVDIDDQTLNILRTCTALTEVNLRNYGNQKISSEGLIGLFQVTPNLLALDVAYCKAFDDDVLYCVARKCAKLIELSVEGCNVTNDGLVNLTSNNRKLRCLTLSQTKITGEGISKVAEGKYCCHLHELRLDNCSKVDDDVLKTVIHNCPRIEILTFYNCPITDETSIFQDITVACKNLKQLHWTITW